MKVNGKRIGNNKGQEEMVGFVMVMVLVVVIFLVFLGLSLRHQTPEKRESQIVYQFLDSLMEQTTECALNQGNDYLTLDSLIRECHSSNSACGTGEDSCALLNRTLMGAMESSWKVGPDYPLKGYELQAAYLLDNTGQQQTSEEVFLIKEGTCAGSVVGNSYWIPEFPGSITTTLKLCS